MTKTPDGFHHLQALIPAAAWDALAADADARGVSVAHLVTDLIFKRYRIPLKKRPPPKRRGRKPKEKG